MSKLNKIDEINLKSFSIKHVVLQPRFTSHKVYYYQASTSTASLLPNKLTTYCIYNMAPRIVFRLRELGLLTAAVASVYFFFDKSAVASCWDSCVDCLCHVDASEEDNVLDRIGGTDNGKQLRTMSILPESASNPAFGDVSYLGYEQQIVNDRSSNCCTDHTGSDGGKYYEGKKYEGKYPSSTTKTEEDVANDDYSLEHDHRMTSSRMDHECTDDENHAKRGTACKEMEHSCGDSAAQSASVNDNKEMHREQIALETLVSPVREEPGNDDSNMDAERKQIADERFICKVADGEYKVEGRSTIVVESEKRCISCERSPEQQTAAEEPDLHKKVFGVEDRSAISDVVKNNGESIGRGEISNNKGDGSVEGGEISERVDRASMDEHKPSEPSTLQPQEFAPATTTTTAPNTSAQSHEDAYTGECPILRSFFSYCLEPKTQQSELISTEETTNQPTPQQTQQPPTIPACPYWFQQLTRFCCGHSWCIDDNTLRCTRDAGNKYNFVALIILVASVYCRFYTLFHAIDDSFHVPGHDLFNLPFHRAIDGSFYPGSFHGTISHDPDIISHESWSSKCTHFLANLPYVCGAFCLPHCCMWGMESAHSQVGSEVGSETRRNTTHENVPPKRGDNLVLCGHCHDQRAFSPTEGEGQLFQVKSCADLYSYVMQIVVRFFWCGKDEIELGCCNRRCHINDNDEPNDTMCNTKPKKRQHDNQQSGEHEELIAFFDCSNLCIQAFFKSMAHIFALNACCEIANEGSSTHTAAGPASHITTIFEYFNVRDTMNEAPDAHGHPLSKLAAVATGQQQTHDEICRAFQLFCWANCLNMRREFDCCMCDDPHSMCGLTVMDWEASSVRNRKSNRRRRIEQSRSRRTASRSEGDDCEQCCCFAESCFGLLQICRTLGFLCALQYGGIALVGSLFGASNGGHAVGEWFGRMVEVMWRGLV